MMDSEAKSEYRRIVDQLSKLKHDIYLLELQLKEKDQELKLNELKYKELKKQLPHKRLRPLPGR